MNALSRRRPLSPGIALGALMCVLMAGCGAKSERGAEMTALSAVTVRVQKVERKQRPVVEEVVGTVRARLRATLEAKVSGRIESLPIALGQQVRAGQVLVRLDAPEVNARLDQASAALEQAERDFKRVAQLYETGTITRAEYDSADSRVRIAKAGVAEARALLGYVEITSPFDGVITRKWLESGDLASPGKPLVDVQNPADLQLDADVPEAIASHIRQSASLTVRVDSANRELAGTISEIAPVADPVSRTFRVKLDLPKTEGVMPGQFARLLVPVGESAALRVPAATVIRRGQLELVFVAAGQQARMRLVKTGKKIGDEIEILSGLEAGEGVIVENAAQLADGQPLAVK